MAGASRERRHRAEGAGYAGGIVSAALDGLRSARAVVERYARLEPPREG